MAPCLKVFTLDFRLRGTLLTTSDIAFQNRKLESEIVREVALGAPDNARVCILRAAPAAGLTSFLKHAAQLVQSEDCLTIYSSSLRSGSSLIYDDFFLSLSQQMEALARRIERPEAFRKFVRDTIGGGLSFFLPGGAMLKPATEQAFDRIRSTYHSSQAADRFARLVTTHLKSKSILFLIDNAQFIASDDLDVFRDAIGDAKSNVRFLLGYVDRPNSRVSLVDLKDRIESVGQSVTVSPFKIPDHLLAEDILSAAGVFESESQAARIAEETEGNAHRLISVVRTLKSGAPQGITADLSKEAKALLQYLVAAEQPLPISVLSGATKFDPTVKDMDDSEVARALSSLERQSTISWKSYLGKPFAAEISVSSDEEVAGLRANRVLMLTARNSLYQALVRDHVETEPSKDYKAALLYTLSLDVDPERSQRYALELVAGAIRSGSLQTAKVFADALPEPNSTRDEQAFLLTVAFRIATKRYEDALVALDQAPETAWSASETAQVYRAISLNRCRKHVEANALIGDLLRKIREPEVISVLGAIKIAGLMHLGEVESAQRTFEGLASKAKGASNEGYFLRNGAAAFPATEAIRYLLDAKVAFEREKDHFGAGTCQANIGSIRANAGDFDTATAEFNGALTALSPFGFGHMEEVLCNLAFLDVRDGNHRSAAHRLGDMLRYSQPNMPKLYALDHMALLETMLGHHDKARNYISEGDALCVSVEVPVAQIRHQLNTALLQLLLGDERSSIEELNEIVASAQGQNKVVADGIVRKIESVRESPTPGAVLKAYSPGFLEYWSFDALGLLPRRLLPQIAEC
ncbi:hypothetical protein ACSQ76_22105 [Roseovarius sp. B08]|uniref:hypothetical protein n=1 Tax=Roseovarius sp. B08 TaxID=3449223 RepID=UPI003EDBFB4D